MFDGVVDAARRASIFQQQPKKEKPEDKRKGARHEGNTKWPTDAWRRGVLDPNSDARKVRQRQGGARARARVRVSVRDLAPLRVRAPQSWDMVMMLFLGFCAVVTPFEIAYVNHEPDGSPMGIINLTVDSSESCASARARSPKTYHHDSRVAP